MDIDHDAPTNPWSPLPEKDPNILTVAEAAHLLRVNRKTLYESIQLGNVPGVVHLGRVIRLHRTALVSWFTGNAGSALGRK
jgi:excisionase family DNA binding protein